MTISYDYLEKMFRRLDEARSQRMYMLKEQLLEKQKGKPVKNPITDRDLALAENWILSVKYSIKDYLETHDTNEVK